MWGRHIVCSEEKKDRVWRCLGCGRRWRRRLWVGLTEEVLKALADHVCLKSLAIRHGPLELEGSDK